MYNPGVTCFADIPVNDLSLHMRKYSCVGLSFSKDFIARAGGAPVHYIPLHSKVTRYKEHTEKEKEDLKEQRDWDEMLKKMYEEIDKGKYFDEMVQEYHALFEEMRQYINHTDTSPGVSPLSRRIGKLHHFLAFHVFSYLKFFDHEKSDEDPDNYYFEREWRVVGHVRFTHDDVKTVFVPSTYARAFRETFPEYAGQLIFTD
ncbi:abortive infection system antitoxin AbiGi family protein [Aquisalimonas lutea]|uniref:abortive infection system antitoxin AbiGi family protein n=1 Tax=Aquisalimonas lutea TaxID=1327750 RepID=UPI0025B59CA7|nr:abortive infection system antitoxin AbiGi family protein [Aquisalimonas lutea]MDN3517062.1 abortive infection system antitoxin AbiGi family protein [Aquisalimonas lutea]